MLEKIRIAVLMLLGILCITAYVVSFSLPLQKNNIDRNLASEKDFEFSAQ